MEHDDTIRGIREDLAELKGRMVAFENHLTSFEARVDRRFESIEDTLRRQLMWTAGIQISVLLAVVTALTVMVSTLATR